MRSTESLILVAGSDAGSWGAIKKALAGRHTVAFAIDLVGTLELLRRERPKALLLCSDFLDADLPSSIQRVQERHPDLPLFVLGGPQAHSGLESGVHYIANGTDPDELRHVIGEALERAPRESGDRIEVDLPAYRRVVIGQSAAMRKVEDMVRRVAEFNVPVLLLGESGTGKELFARRIHCLSERARGPFRALNLSAVPSSLFESVMFGHERGAFTGAVKQESGAFEQACGGTLFLDEVSSAELLVQPKLLRALQEREVERVGGRQPISCDVRVIAATNVDLSTAVANGEFREDLYHRLAVVTIVLPPLRSRVEDIPILVDHFCKIHARRFGRDRVDVPDAVIRGLQRHPWPGNVRELENRVQRALLLSGDRDPQLEDFLGEEVSSASSGFHFGKCDMSLAEVEVAYINQVLARNDGNQSRAADILKIDRKTLRAKRERARKAPALVSV